MRDVFTGTPSKLGFGLMRLPRDKSGKIDVEETSHMVDAALEAGVTYFDTAYVYEGSEEAIRKALVERHPRNTFTLTDKLNAGFAKNEEEAKNQIHVSLERTGAGYFDYYLLHAISEDNIDRYEKFHIWDYMHELLEKGL
ncbi:MAG: aldo/keto reductase, partial [Lachnospiraceae bacterium]